MSDRFDESQLISEFGFDVSKWQSVKQLVEKYHDRIFCIWNLAAPLSVEAEKNPKISEQVTVGGMKNVLEAMKKFKVRKLCFSDSIGSFGKGSPPEQLPSPASWSPTQIMTLAPHMANKAACRRLMKDFSDFDPRNDTRFAVIPGVLHNSSEWGDGTTEYALDALKFGSYSSNKVYHCPVPLNKNLPMIYIDDLVNGLYLLMVTKKKYLKEPAHGYSMAGFSFNANRLFDEIRSKYNESFKFKLEIMQKKSKEPTPAFVFANLWPCSLSPYEAQNDLQFYASYNFEKTVSIIIQNHRKRRKTDAKNARNVILKSLSRK